MNGDATVWFLAGIGVGLACAILAFAAIAALDRRALRGARGRPLASLAQPDAARPVPPQMASVAAPAVAPTVVRSRDTHDAEDEIFAALAKARQASDSEPREPSVVIDFPEPARSPASAATMPTADQRADQRAEALRTPDRARIGEARTAAAPVQPDAPVIPPRRSFERPPAAAAPSPAAPPPAAPPSTAPAAIGNAGINGAGAAPTMPPARSRPLVPPPAANTQTITPPAAAAPAPPPAATSPGAASTTGPSVPVAPTPTPRPAAPRPQIAPLPPPSAAPRRRFTEILVPADSVPLPENATEAPPTARPIPASRPKIGASTPTPPPNTVPPPAPSRPAYRAPPPVSPAAAASAPVAAPIGATVAPPAAAPVAAPSTTPAAPAPVVPDSSTSAAKSGAGTPASPPTTFAMTRPGDDNSVEALFAEAFGLQHGDGDGPLPEGPPGK